MIASIGGSLGLFTGISVITIVEIIYWSGRLLLTFVDKNIAKERTISPDAIATNLNPMTKIDIY